jgi:hypothetical protein
MDGVVYGSLNGFLRSLSQSGGRGNVPTREREQHAVHHTDAQWSIFIDRSPWFVKPQEETAGVVRDDFELSRRGWKLLLHHSHLLRLMNERSRELNCNQGYCLYGLSLRPDDACRGPYIYGCCGGMPSVISRTVWTRARVVEQVMSKGSCTPSHHIDHRMDHVHHGGVVDGTARTQFRAAAGTKIQAPSFCCSSGRGLLAAGARGGLSVPEPASANAALPRYVFYHVRVGETKPLLSPWLKADGDSAVLCYVLVIRR